MVKLIIMFRHPANTDQFENSYNDFLALLERMPHLVRRQVVHTLGSPQGAPPYYRMLELYFETLTQLQDSLLSAPGQEAGAELGRFDAESVEMLYADVYEEESLPSA